MSYNINKGKTKDKASSLFDIAFKNKPKAPLPDKSEGNSVHTSYPTSRVSVAAVSTPQSSSQASTSVFDFIGNDEEVAPPKSDITTVSKQKRSAQAMEVDEFQEDAPALKLQKDASHSTSTKRSMEKLCIDDASKNQIAKKWKNDDGGSVPSTSAETEPQTKNVFFTKKNRPPAIYHHAWTSGDKSPRDTPKPRVVRRSNEHTEPPPKFIVLDGRGKIRFSVPVDRATPVQKIRNVRDPSQCLQSGEHDDHKKTLDYFMEILVDNTSNTRVKALCMVQLTRQCSSVGFRQFLRSRNAFNQIMTLPTTQVRESSSFNVSLAGFIFMMTREQGLIPFYGKTVSSVASLLKTIPTPTDDPDLECCNDIHKRIDAILQDGDTSSANKDSLLEILRVKGVDTQILLLDSLATMATWKVDPLRGAVFPKDDLVSHGCLQFITEQMRHFVDRIVNEPHCWRTHVFPYILAYLERSLRIIEFATEFHKRNQSFMISHRSGLVINVCAKFFKFCLSFFSYSRAADDDPALQEFRDYDIHVLNCLEACCRALVNLTHENEMCAGKLGGTGDFLKTAVQLFVFVLPKYAAKSYDLRLLLCSLLINLVEKCKENGSAMSKLVVTFFIKGEEEEYACLDGFTKLFLFHEGNARTIDEALDRDLVDVNEEEDENEQSDGRLKRPHEMTEAEMLKTVQDAMNKATLHMEDSVCASYVALLLGCLLQHDRDSAESVRAQMPGSTFAATIDQLTRFFEFMKEASKGCDSGSVFKIIKVFQKYDEE
uniref:WAPL domain-containing protein n=1 Tax=Steinernema glaseri TaxID=37863 RepID=A0A1I7ZI56_9BILA